jgi:signal recognition particle receptor subunit beta
VVLINSTTMSAMTKVVYYGPGLCGKTTNLQQIHAKTAPSSRGEMLSLETETDRTLFFDLLPLEVGIVGGMKVRLQLYTVPGQVFYNATRKVVLTGADGIVFVADSQADAFGANVESLQNLRENLAELGTSLDETPLVLQYNKRDLQQIATVEALQKALNPGSAPYFEASARYGLGVFETLKGISRLAIEGVRRKLEAGGPPRKEDGPSEPAAAGVGETQPMRALQDVDFAEETTAKYSVRAVATKGAGALHEEIEKVRAGQVELERHAKLALPRALLRKTARIGVHLSLQGEEVSLKDAVSVPLTADEREKDTLRLRIDLEIEGTD